MKRPAPRARPSAESPQLPALTRLLSAVRSSNPFYRRKLRGLPIAPASGGLAALIHTLPFTTKEELVMDQQKTPPYGTNLTFPRGCYVRCHQTSGTSGTPVRWLDTPESWEAMLDCWMRVYQASGVTARDRILFAFSFGPFLGFWTAFEAASQRLGALCLPGGGQSTAARIRLIRDHRATVVCCTPTYALHLAETARAAGEAGALKSVKRLLVAGEPGGSHPAMRRRLREAWGGARVWDHHGMTEVGPVSYACPKVPGILHVIEDAYVAEVIDPLSATPLGDGLKGELVLTNLWRTGSPLIRYRTGDVVDPLPRGKCRCGSRDLALKGGILGRTDDMVVVRGVNLYPAAVDDVVRAVGGIAEYQVTVTETSGLSEVALSVEPAPGTAAEATLLKRLQEALHEAFFIRFQVSLAAPGSLPRFEHKARRWSRAGGG